MIKNLLSMVLAASMIRGSLVDADQVLQQSRQNMEGKVLNIWCWNAEPGLFAYRRSIAKDILGTDDPEEVQAALSDWNKFNKVAAQAKDKGYYMLPSYYDSFRVFSNNVDKPWVGGADAPFVETTTVTVDSNIMAWIKQTKEFTDNGYNHKAKLWSDRWMQKIAADPDFESELLGGQNPVGLFSEAASAVDMSNVSAYDQGCNEEIQNAFINYFDGYIDLDAAKDNFETAIKKRYPEIVRVEWSE